MIVRLFGQNWVPPSTSIIWSNLLKSPWFALKYRPKFTIHQAPLGRAKNGAPLLPPGNGSESPRIAGQADPTAPGDPVSTRGWVWGSPKNGATPKMVRLTSHGKSGYPHSWMVNLTENPNLKWMITRGTPIAGNLQIYSPEIEKYGAALVSPRVTTLSSTSSNTKGRSRDRGTSICSRPTLEGAHGVHGVNALFLGNLERSWNKLRFTWQNCQQLQTLPYAWQISAATIRASFSRASPGHWLTFENCPCVSRSLQESLWFMLKQGESQTWCCLDVYGPV